MKAKKIKIIILTWNGLEYTKRCLKLLKENTKYSQYEVIVVDNGSTDGTVEYLNSLPWVKTIFNSKNVGFVRGNNLAIEKYARGCDVILLNNDVEIYDDKWIQKFQKTAYKEEKIGVVGCRIRRPGGMLQHAGTYMPDFTYWGQQIAGGEKDINQYNEDVEVDGVVFACVYIKSVIIEKIGKLSTDYLSYYEDTDYCLSVFKAGYKVVNCGSLTVLHHECVSTNINKIDHNEIFLKSQKIFKKKWKSFLDKRFDMDISWHSTFSRPFGYAMNSKSVALALEDNKVRVGYKYLYGPKTVFPVKEKGSSGDYRIEVIKRRKLNKSSVQVVYGQGDAFNYVKKGYRVGYTMLETTGIPKTWAKQANSMNEVWTPSPFNAWTFKRSGVKKPICIMPLGVDTNYFNNEITGYPIEGVFTFLSIFEWGERKAPDVLLKAFNTVFKKQDPVVLICKYINYDGGIDINKQIEALDLDPNGGQIIFSVNQRVPYYQLSQFYRSADCFVLPTRGEGWGMPILEAMACGIPVIATYWSAQQFFMTDANSYPLQVKKLIKAEAKCPYYKGFKWAELDIEHLKYLLKKVYRKRDQAKEKGALAASFVKEKLSLDKSGKRIRQRIFDINNERTRKEKPSFNIIIPKNEFKTKIGIDISRSIGEQITGIGRATNNLIKGLALLDEKDNPFEFLLFPGFGDYVHPLYMKEYFYKNSYKNRFTLYRGPLPAFSCVDHYVPGLNVVHSTGFMKPKIEDIPLVLTVYDLTFLLFPQYHTKENIKLCKSNMKKAIDSNCYFFAISKNTKKDIVNYYKIDPSRVSVVYVSIDLNEFFPASLENIKNIKRKYDLPERFFLYVGSLEPRKNLKTAIKAIQQYNKEETLVVVGASGWKNSDLAKLMEKNRENIKVLGYVPQEDLPLLYSAAYCSIYPSIYEGFGMPVLESMACGTPVIASNNSSIPEVAGNACMLIDDVESQEELCNAMVKLSSDEQFRQELSDKGIKQAKKFDLKIGAKTLVNEYSQIINLGF